MKNATSPSPSKGGCVGGDYETYNYHVITHQLYGPLYGNYMLRVEGTMKHIIIV